MSFEFPPFRMVIALVIVALISATAGVALWKLVQDNQRAPAASLIMLPEPRVIADFRLVDQDGRLFSLENLRGRWSLLFFGFTHCPDVCPGTLYDLHRVHSALVEKSGGMPPAHQVLFVSIDPERDTPEKLKQYVAHFDPAFIGVTGSHEQLQPLTMQLGIAYRIEDHEAGDAQYSVDHSARILLMGPDGRLHGVFPAPHDASKIISDMDSFAK